jgi:lysozyme family protein
MFADSLAQVLKAEGGYSNVGNDRGKETYMGISRFFFPKWEGWQIIDKYKPLKNNQIVKNDVLDEMVKQFYKTNFWDPIRADQINAGIAPFLFDFAVNSGVGAASKAFQKVVSQLSGRKLVIDGKIGSGTIAAASSINPKLLFDALMNYRIAFYKNIVDKDPSQSKFLNGWLNRLKKYQFEIQISAGIFIAIIGFWLLFRK